MKAIIFDIDGTIADLSHRLAYITGKKKDYEAFYAQVKADSPIEPIIDLTNVLHTEFKILLVSGRPEKTRADTLEWLEENCVSYDELYMRPDGDFRPDYIVKSQILDGILHDGYSVDMVVDDRTSVVEMWRDRGLICLQCRDWNDTKRKTTALLTIMVGPAGAGKTTWLAESKIADCDIIASDQIRQNLCGDFKDQSKNDQVFAALHDIVKTRLKHGLHTAIDATNIRTKDRKACAALAQGGDIQYIVVDRPMDVKRASGGWRNTLPEGFDLIGKHDQVFKSNLSDIFAGDFLPNVRVIDERKMFK